MSRRNEDGIPLPDDGDMNLEDSEYQAILEDIARREERGEHTRTIANRVIFWLLTASITVNLARTISYGTDGEMGMALFNFGWAVFALIVMMWNLGTLNVLFDNTSPEDLRQAADERANKAGRAPSWHPDHIH